MSNPTVLPPQQSIQRQPQGETSAMVLAAKAKALVEARYLFAEAHPRDLDVVRQSLLKECKRPSFAEVARYRKPIGAGIEGPSIRFAEAAIRCMKNITVETDTVYDDQEKRIMRVTVTDLEANVPYSQDVTVQKTVERRRAKAGDAVLRSRLNSQGDTVFIIEATDDDILNKQNALVSKAVRTLGLRLVPGDIIDEAMDTVIAVQKQKDAQDPDAVKKKLLDFFAEKGVSVAQIKEYLGHGVEMLEPKELLDLRALATAIRDGETTWREVMDAKNPGEATEDKPGTTRANSVLDAIKKKNGASHEVPTAVGTGPVVASVAVPEVEEGRKTTGESEPETQPAAVSSDRGTTTSTHSTQGAVKKTTTSALF